MNSLKIIDRQFNERPNVTLSYCQSLDGCIALSRGTPCSLSGLESQTLTHKLRATHDAILVGIDTVIADNPCLTVRLVQGRSPVPIVLDSHLRLPLSSKLLKNQITPIIATTTSASFRKQQEIEESGAKVIRTPSNTKGWVDLPSLLEELVNLKINNVMVEGGARVITSFLSQHLVDWIVITVAPTLLGGLHAIENPLASCGKNLSEKNGLPEFKNSGFEQVGKDIILWSALSWANH